MKHRTKKMQQKKTRRFPKRELLGLRVYSQKAVLCDLYLNGRTVQTAVENVEFVNGNFSTPRAIVYGGKKKIYPIVRIFSTLEKRREYMSILGIEEA